LLLIFFSIVSYLLTPLLALYLSTKGYEIIANCLWGFWVVGIFGKLVSIPLNLKRNNSMKKVHEKLLDLYKVLGDITISTELLSQRLKAAEDNKVGLDGSIYALAEILRKESPFL
jgi:hypothetical protein